MKKIIQTMRTLGATIALSILLLVASVNQAVLAANVETGAKVFAANCAACHMGGGNAVNPSKTLKQAALAANGKNTVDAIVAQVTNGKGAMPAFKGRLQEDQIQSVAMYVLEKADKGW